MKSLGDTLKTTREERGISMDQVVHETNISRSFLEALEEEHFEDFPAEAYLVGFLRNYAEFLGLDPDKIVGQFKNYKLSEEPTPMEQLVGPPQGRRARRVILIVVLVLTAAAAVVFLPGMIGMERPLRSRVTREPDVQPQEIRPEMPLWEGPVTPSDIMVLANGAEELRISVSAADDGLVLDAGPAGLWSVILGAEISVPGSGGQWRIYMKDFGLPGGAGILEVQWMPVVLPDEALPDTEPPSGLPQRRRDVQTLLNAASPRDFTLDIVFNNLCLFRYSADGQEVQEAYFGAGELLRIDVSRTLTVWASNAGSLTARTGGQDILPGQNGEVSVRQIRWIRNPDSGLFDLSVFPLY